MTGRLLRRSLNRLMTSSVCQSRIRSMSSASKLENESIDITFLGTGSGGPTRSRNSAAIVFRWQGKQMLFDCGEGTLRQLIGSQLGKPQHLDLIFITHLHGDHIFGLPSILLHISTAISSSYKSVTGCNMDDHTAPRIRVYGPIGLYDFICTTLTISESVLHTHIEVFELEDLHTPPNARNSRKHARHSRIHRHSIPRQSDGTWQLHELSGKSSGPTLTIRAAAVKHTIPSLGFVVEESPLPGTLDVQAARRLGLEPGPAYGMLKEGRDVMLKDGKTVVRSKDVVGPSTRGRKVVIVGDTCDPSGPLQELALGADLVVHEATVPGKRSHAKAYDIGHSTPSMAGDFAFRVGALGLVLTHFGSRYDSGYFNRNMTVLTPTHSSRSESGGFSWSGRGLKHPDQIVTTQLVEEAQESFGKNRVVAANDFMVIKIPRGGFSAYEPMK